MEEMKSIMADCRKGGIRVLLPDVNESEAQFSVNRDGDIRYGLGGLKGFGDNIVAAIIRERNDNGRFADLYDFLERMSGVLSRRALETLVYSGVLDSFGIGRKQYFAPGASGELFIDELVRYMGLYRKDTLDSASSLFGEEELKPVRPDAPTISPTGEDDSFELLQKEKEYVGMYLSSHPLDRFRFEIENFTTCSLSRLQNAVDEAESADRSAKAKVAGIVTSLSTIQTRTGTPGMKFVLEDFSGNYEFALFGKDYQAFQPYVQLHTQILVEGEIKPRYRISTEEAKAGKKAPYAFRFKSISPLGLVSEDNVESLEILVDTANLNEQFRKNLVRILKGYKGRSELIIRLDDRQSGYKINMRSKKYRVRVCQDLLDETSRAGMITHVTTKQ